MNKKIIIVSAAIAVIGLPVYAISQSPEPSKPKQEELTVVTVDKPMPEPVKEDPVRDSNPAPVVSTPAPVIPAEPTPAPAATSFKSFDQIIRELPNMSRSAEEVKCSEFIRDNFPQHMTPELMEKSLGLISSTFTSSCSAVGMNPSAPSTKWLVNVDGNGKDFWQVRM